MSVINKMLKDLENRRARVEQPDLGSMGVHAVPGAPNARKLALIAGLGTVVLAGVYLGSFDLPGLRRETSVAPNTVQVAKVALRAEQQGSSAKVAEKALPETAALAQPPAREESVASPPDDMEMKAAALRVDEKVSEPGSALTTATTENSEHTAPISHTPRADPTKQPRAQPAKKQISTAKAEPSSAPVSNALPERNVEPASIEKNMLQPTPRERAEKLLDAGLLATRERIAADARKSFREAIEADPTFDRGRQAFLSALLEAGDKPAAESVADDGVAHGGARAAFALVSARLKLERGANLEALSRLEGESADGARNPDYLALWGNTLARQRRHAEAARKYAQAVELAPTNPAHYIGMAYALRNDGQYAAAQSAFQATSEMPNLSPQLVEFVQQQLDSLQRLLTNAANQAASR